jgi:hypothetical protein
LKITPWVACIEFAEGPTFYHEGNLDFVNYVRNPGLRCDRNNRLIVAHHPGKRLLRISQDREIEVLADHFR